MNPVPSDSSATPLKTRITQWCDWDYAQMELAICLGLMTDETDYQVKAKHVFWSKNPMGDMLHETLEKLVKNGVLEFRDDPDRGYMVRWNPNYKGTWE